MNFICVSLLMILFISGAGAHSMISYPESMTPKVCRMGGDPNPGDCPGPCDLTAVRGGFANFDSPSNPAAVYRRGQRVTIKYQRNNHGPGGFLRHTLVPVDSMMNKNVHVRNAFHYSCFGATPVQATNADIVKDHWGYNIAGNDGKKTPVPGYYETKLTIPAVVPDGDYVFGWVWYGGTGGDVSNTLPYAKPPFDNGYFTDYWSCSFVRIEGGDAVQSKFTPEFVNDMRRWSDKGCMSANDAPGVCKSEPCIDVYADYQMPRPFKFSRKPDDLTPDLFQSDYDGPIDRSSGSEVGLRSSGSNSNEGAKESSGTSGSRRESTDPDGEEFLMKKRACRCLGRGTRCGGRIARRSEVCLRRMEAEEQPLECKQECCSLCKLGSEEAEKVCNSRKVKMICGM